MLLPSLHNRLAEHDLHLTFVMLGKEDFDDGNRTPKLLRESMVDGLLVNYNTEIPDRLIEWIAKYEMPAVWLNSKQPADCVYPDDFGSARLATQRLLEMGHRRVAYFEWMSSLHYSFTDRRSGYAAAMAEAGLTPRTIHGSGNMFQRGAVDAEYRWLASSDRPTAVICYGPESLTELAMAAVYHQLAIPNDLSICTFHDRQLYLFGEAVGCVILPEAKIAATAVDILMRKIETRGLEFAPKPVLGELAEGNTLAPPPP
jgi:DNA-binding LacI/PurR family transcriptional regulator